METKRRTLKVTTVNFNHPIQNSNAQNAFPLKLQEKNLNCFSDDDWTGNAANAVGEAFNNMDDLIELFKENTKLE